MANKKILDRLQEATGLKADGASGQLYGFYNGYHVRLVPYNPNNAYNYMACFSLSFGGTEPRKEEIKEIAGGTKTLSRSIRVKGFSVSFFIRSKMTLEKTAENIRTALGCITEQLMVRGYRECCENCGREAALEHYRMGNEYQLLCSDCFSKKGKEISARSQREALKEETVIGGVIGACSALLSGQRSLCFSDSLGMFPYYPA